MINHKGYVEISSGVFIECKRIKLITQRKTVSESFRKLVHLTKENKTYVKLAPAKPKDNVYVIVDDYLYLVSFTYEELIQHLVEAGIKLVPVSSDAYVSVTYIKAIYDLENELVSWSIKNYKLPEAILQFVSFGERRKTALVLRSDEVVYLSKSAKDVLEEIGQI